MQIGLLFLLTTVFVLSGCGERHIETLTAPEIGGFALGPVALSPFKPSGGFREGLRSNGIDPRGALFLTKRFSEKLRSLEVTVLVVSDSHRDRRPDEKLSDFHSAQAVEIGRIYNVPVVLFGYISAYTNREGSAVGIERPASVDFSVHLIETKNGQPLWSGRFHETQKSLFEDITEFPSFLKRRGRWIEVDELAGTGLDALLKKSPWKREKNANLSGH